MKGLEPLPLSEPDPKSGASTNSATPAYRPDKSLQNYAFFYYKGSFILFLTGMFFFMAAIF